ncbi:MAG: amidohydrolase family protein [Alphaproteobacteria bacterium]|jgi:cytosine/adenosine deaminase-related metal-dependent hydrolase|nr:amidohydrolase family protein [Alphaproteobacteria bacterium]
MTETTILVPEHLLPEADPKSLQAGTAVAVEGDRIAAIDAPAVLEGRFPTARIEALPGALLMPGFVNAHQHGRGISQLQLGYAEDFLELWISSRRARGALDPYPITKLAAAAMLENGVTTAVHANYSYGSGDYEAEVRAALRAYDEAGIRVTMCIGAMDRGFVVYPPDEAAFLAGLPADLRHWLEVPAPGPYVGDGTATIALMERLLADYAGHPRIRLCYGPAGLQWVSDALMAELAADAEAKGLGLHLHLIESPAQQAVAARLYPEGAMAHLDSLGALGERTVLAHGVYADARDLAAIARRGAVMVRNPASNLRVRNGVAPLATWLDHGVKVAIGTDNTSLADDEDLLRELRLADLLARTPDWQGPPPPNAADLLAMLTANGAAAAQVSDLTGSLRPGARADLVAIDLETVREPYLDPDMPLLDALLARASGRDVRLTMVDGRVLYRDGALVHLDMAELRQNAGEAARRVRSPAGAEDVRMTLDLKDRLAAHYARATSGSP